MSQSIWIGIGAESLGQLIGIAAVRKEDMDRGGVIQLPEWNSGLEAISKEGTVIGYGIIVNEDFPDEFDSDDINVYQAFIPAIERVLKQFGLLGSVGVNVSTIDGSLVPVLEMGAPKIPSVPDVTVH